MLVFSLLQLKVLDAEKEQKGKEVAELQTRLALEEQREEERGKEVFCLKQKLTESEAIRESIKKEVRMVCFTAFHVSCPHGVALMCNSVPALSDPEAPR